MNLDRRRFLISSAGAAAMAGGFAAGAPFPLPSPRAGVAPAPRKLKLLVLGGTRFLGPAIVRRAQERGHELTLFNRGKSRPGLFDAIEQIHGDRDPKKDEGAGLKQIAGRKWDACLDTSGFYPRIVKASCDALAENVGHYVFVSTVSVYAKDDTPGADETAATGTLTDPANEDMGKEFERYGPFKRLCEEAVEAAFPGRTANVRPGYIVGPEDNSDRFTYWPARVARGGEVLAPGTPDDPIQVIDVRDLGAWLVHLAEAKTAGIFNAVGPEKKTGIGAVLETCKKAAASDASFTWIPWEFLEKQGEKGDEGIPIWMPPIPKYAGYHARSGAKALKHGLTLRPLPETVSDLLAWWKSLPEDRRAKPRAGMTPAREAEILAAWRAAAAGR